jgi:hypothetical protein
LNLFQQAKTWRVHGFWRGGLSDGERMDIEQNREYKAAEKAAEDV